MYWNAEFNFITLNPRKFISLKCNIILTVLPRNKKIKLRYNL